MQLGDAGVCGTGLSASWAMCSTVPMGNTTATIRVAPPTPVAISMLSVLPQISSLVETAALVGFSVWTCSICICCMKLVAISMLSMLPQISSLFETAALVCQPGRCT
jgi:hypothetical protein